jgi:hypothetical protein
MVNGNAFQKSSLRIKKIENNNVFGPRDHNGHNLSESIFGPRVDFCYKTDDYEI